MQVMGEIWSANGLAVESATQAVAILKGVEMIRFTIRDLLLWAVFVAIGCAALKYPTSIWCFAISVFSLTAFMAAVVMTIADRGRRQAAAAGFVACFAIYQFVSINNLRGLDPTAFLFQPLFDSLDQNNRFTLQYFLLIKPMLVAIFFGYFGSRFASWVYLRRDAAGQATTADAAFADRALRPPTSDV